MDHIPTVSFVTFLLLNFDYKPAGLILPFWIWIFWPYHGHQVSLQEDNNKLLSELSLISS